MSENKQKKQRHDYNILVIKHLMSKYDFSRRYIVMSISGERVGKMSIKIQEEYKVLAREIKETIQKAEV